MISTIAFILTVQTAPKLPDARPEDVKSVDTIVAALYDVISGPAGKPRDWTRFKSLFSPKGTLAAVVKGKDGKPFLATMTPDSYATGNAPYFEKNSFFEKETKRKTMKAMDIVHVFSDYESRKAVEDKKPFESGTNAIQMYSDGTRWYIHSILWQGN